MLLFQWFYSQISLLLFSVVIGDTAPGLLLFLWQDKTKPLVLRDVLQCCSCRSQTVAAPGETALHRGLGQRRVEHESL